MKVAFVSQPWDTLQLPVSAGSIPIWTAAIAQKLSNQKSSNSCDVIVYARRSEGQLAHETYKGVSYRRIEVSGTRIYNGIAKALSRLSPTFRYLCSRLYCFPYALRIATDLRKQSCDIVHIHNFSQFVPVIRALNPTIKIVLHMHCEWLSQFDRDAIAPRLHKTDLIIGCSDYITNKIRARFPELAHRCQRVYNGVDTEQFQPVQPVQSAQSETPKSTENLKLLFVGRISPEKGLHTLIEAFERVAIALPPAKLFLIGPNKPTAAEFIAELSDEPIVQNLAQLDPPNYLQNLKRQLPEGLEERVFFTGSVSHLTLHQHFQTAAVLVNPSLSEAFGMSLVEAMATRIPTVATRVGGMQDVVVDGETGLLVPPDDSAALAIALQTLLTDSDLRARMGKAGRERAVTVFDWAAIAAHLFSLYDNLLSTKEASS